MTAGYFEFGDPAQQIALDEYAVINREWENPVIVREAHNKLNVALLETGGDVNNLSVWGGTNRFSRGDADWRGYQMLLELGASGLGKLAINGKLYSGSFFTSGDVRVDGHRFLTYRLRFLQSAELKGSSLGSAGSPPAAPGVYSGRSSAGLYTFGGQALGIYAEMDSIRVSRTPVVTRIPRCYGARIQDKVFGRRVELTLAVWSYDITRVGIETWVRDVITAIGTTPATLAGNGNSWTSCHLSAFSIAEGDWKNGDLTLNFQQALE